MNDYVEWFVPPGGAVASCVVAAIGWAVGVLLLLLS